MGAPILTLAPAVGDLAALGARSPEDLIGTGAGLEGEELIPPPPQPAAGARRQVLRCPLPGTPQGVEGRPRGRPRGAGTGWILVRRYRGATLGQALRARLAAPRSDSLASREWNLLCHLRAAGVTTPEPLAVAREGHPVFSPRSALVTRALEAMTPAPEWFAREGDPGRRRLALRSVGLTLRRLGRSGVDLPHLAPAHLWIADDPVPADGVPAGGVSAGGVSPAGGLPWSALPEVAVTCVRDGRLRPRPAPGRLERMLARLAADEGTRGLAPRERLKVYLLATRGLLPRSRRRAATRLPVPTP